MLSQFTGFNLEFRIKDATEDINVFEDRRNSITEEDKLSYWNRFEELFCRFIDDGDFLSYKRVKYFDEELWNI